MFKVSKMYQSILSMPNSKWMHPRVVSKVSSEMMSPMWMLLSISPSYFRSVFYSYPLTSILFKSMYPIYGSLYDSDESG